jgi:hypothetical protein
VPSDPIRFLKAAPTWICNAAGFLFDLQINYAYTLHRNSSAAIDFLTAVRMAVIIQSAHVKSR